MLHEQARVTMIYQAVEKKKVFKSVSGKILERHIRRLLGPFDGVI